MATLINRFAATPGGSEIACPPPTKILRSKPASRLLGFTQNDQGAIRMSGTRAES
jgi:hypothetical protein